MIKILDVTGSDWQYQQSFSSVLVYKKNDDGTYHILKDRYGTQGKNVSSEELIDILRRLVNGCS